MEYHKTRCKKVRKAITDALLQSDVNIFPLFKYLCIGSTKKNYNHNILDQQ